MQPNEVLHYIQHCSGPILLVTHQFPDHDAIGSTLALAQELKHRGRDVTVWVPEWDEVLFCWMPGYDLLQKHLDATASFALVIALDAANFDRIPNNQDLTPILDSAPLLNIDHHMDNTLYGTKNYVIDISSVGEQLTQLFLAWNWKISAETATCLYAAITTDTGRFLFSNTSGQTFQSAGYLLESGADHGLVSLKIYESKSAEDFQAIALAMSNFKVNKQHRYGYSFHAYPSPDSQAKPIDTIRQCADIDIAMFFHEIEPGTVKISLRSKQDFDVSAFAAQFGGGGHKKASGIIQQGGLADIIDLITSKLEQALDA